MYIWKTISKTLLMVLGPLVLIVAVQILGPQFMRERGLRKTRNVMREENARMRAALSETQTNIRRFKTEPTFVERTAHELGLVGEDELVFKFDQ